MFFVLAVILLLLLQGCVTRIVSVSRPRYQTKENQYYYLSITPLSTNDRLCGFRLILKNKTTGPIYIDWNRTFYLQGGERKGGFLFDGIEFEERHGFKKPERVRGRDIYIKTIWPSILADGDREQWTQLPMEPGKHGVEVAIVVNRRHRLEKLEVQVYNRER